MRQSARGGGDARFYDLSISVDMLAQVAALTLFTRLLAGLMRAIYETRRLQTNPLVVLEVAVTHRPAT